MDFLKDLFSKYNDAAASSVNSGSANSNKNVSQKQPDQKNVVPDKNEQWKMQFDDSINKAIEQQEQFQNYQNNGLDDNLMQQLRDAQGQKVDLFGLKDMQDYQDTLGRNPDGSLTPEGMRNSADVANWLEHGGSGVLTEMRKLSETDPTARESSEDVIEGISDVGMNPVMQQSAEEREDKAAKDKENYYNWLYADDRTYADWLENNDTASVDGINYKKTQDNSAERGAEIMSMNPEQFSQWLLDSKGSERWYGTDDDEYGSIGQDVWDAARRGDENARNEVLAYAQRMFDTNNDRYDNAQVDYDEYGNITTDSIYGLADALLKSDGSDTNGVTQRAALLKVMQDNADISDYLGSTTGMGSASNAASALSAIRYLNDANAGKNVSGYSYEDKNLNDIMLAGGLIDPASLDLSYGTKDDVLSESYDPMQLALNNGLPAYDTMSASQYDQYLQDQANGRKINGLWNSYDKYGNGENAYADYILNQLSGQGSNEDKEAYQKALINVINKGKGENDPQLYWRK